MTNATLPGDWTVRGVVIVDRSEECIPNATRIEILRAVAEMIRRGQTVVSLTVEPTSYGTWTKIVAEHKGDDIVARRVAARAFV